MSLVCTRDRESATQFCNCRHQVTLLCDKCLIAHLTAAPGELHDFSPIAYFDACKSLGLDQFHVQKARMISGGAAMHMLVETENTQYESALQKLEESARICRETIETLHVSFLELAAKFEQEKLTLLSAANPPLSAFTNAVLEVGKSSFLPGTSLLNTQALAAFHRSIEALNTRVQAMATQDSLESYFAKVVSEGVAMVATSVQQPGNVEPQPANTGLQPAHNEEAKSYSAPVPENFRPYISVVRGDCLTKYNISTGRVEKVDLSSSVDISLFTVSTILPDGNLLSCGGDKLHDRQSLLINATSGEVTVLPKLKAGRGNPGIVYANGKVYLFGGIDHNNREDLRSAERFEFERREWTLLSASMSSQRFQFTPVLHEQTVYIAGGAHATVAEAFDVPSEQFSTLPLTLAEQGPGFCIVHNGELVVLQNHRVTRWTLNSHEEPRKQEVAVTTKDSNMSVQIVGDKAFYTYETQTMWAILALDLNTWTSAELLKSASEMQPCRTS